MNDAHDTGSDRLHELLTDRATQSLGDEEHDELRSLLAASPGTDETQYDRAAAAVHLSWIARELEPMPDRLRTRIEARSAAWFARNR